jgi:hypothetical protein
LTHRLKVEARAQAAITLGIVAEKYLLRANKLASRTFAWTERHLRKHWSPLSELPIQRVRRADVSARLAEIAGSNGPFAANRARASLSALFSWAIGEGLLDSNPVVGTNKAIDETPRDRVLTMTSLASHGGTPTTKPKRSLEFARPVLASNFLALIPLPNFQFCTSFAPRSKRILSF